jgi:hypothetical protein
LGIFTQALPFFSTGYLEHEEMEQGLAEQLMPSYEDDQTSQGGRLSAPSTLRPASSVVSAYRLLTPSVKVRRVNPLDIALMYVSLALMFACF